MQNDRKNIDEIANAILSINGWNPNRNVPIDNIVKCLSNHGYSVHEKAREFFRQFLGLGFAFVRYDDIRNKKDYPGEIAILREDFIGIGVDPLFRTRLYLEPRNNNFLALKDKMEKSIGSTFCPCVYIYHRGCYVSDGNVISRFIRQGTLKFFSRRMLPKPPLRTQATEYYISEDGRILNPNDHVTTVTVYKSYKDLILYFYGLCDDNFWHESYNSLDIEYLDYGGEFYRM